MLDLAFKEVIMNITKSFHYPKLVSFEKNDVLFSFVAQSICQRSLSTLSCQFFLFRHYFCLFLLFYSGETGFGTHRLY